MKETNSDLSLCVKQTQPGICQLHPVGDWIEESPTGGLNRGEYKITLTKAVTVGMAKIKHQSECG